MNKPNRILKFFLFFLVLSATGVFAQTETKQPQAEPNYEVVLQLLIASNNTGEKTAVPPTLANAVKKLKNVYAFSDYRLTTTLLQRTSGYIEYKSLLTEFNQIADKNYPAFSEWTLKGIQHLPNSQGKNSLQFDSFRFGLRIPILRSFAGESGKTASSIVYDTTGITTSRLNLSENEPTVIGSLTTSKPDELMFLVLTVRTVE